MPLQQIKVITEDKTISHISTLKAKITDLACLASGGGYIGMGFDAHAKTFLNYGGRQSKCEGKLFVEGNKEAWEIGLKKNKDESYDLLWDSYQGGNGLVDVVGKGAVNLLNEYQGALFTKHMAAKGMRVRRTTKEDGSLLMVAA